METREMKAAWHDDHLHRHRLRRDRPPPVQVVGVERCDLEPDSKLVHHQHLRLDPGDRQRQLPGGVWVRNAATTADTWDGYGLLSFPIQ